MASFSDSEFEAACSYAAQSLCVLELNYYQKESLKAIMSGRDVFVSLPTGFGKSMCFQSVPFAWDFLHRRTLGEDAQSILLVVEPTIPIMVDQCTSLVEKGISAAYINHEQKNEEVKEHVVAGKYRFVYISPESLLGVPRFRDMLLTLPYRERLVGIIVDEAHCVSQWNTFRKCFGQLAEIRSIVNDIPLMALTATITPTDKKAVTMSLCMKDPAWIHHDADRPNICLSIRRMPSSKEAWYRLLDDDIELVKTCSIQCDRKIFFCRSIEQTCKLYEYYESMLGEESGYYPPGAAIDPTNRIFAMYHSNSASSVKKAVLESLANPDGKVRRVFATQSLSMGINCQNFRYVYHWGVPRSLEQYFQEVGRGGRDGAPSQAVLLFCDSQLKLENCTQSTIDYCKSTTCLRVTLMNYFGCKVCYNGPCKHCCSACDSD